jgi:hypothetical protein
VSTGKTWRSLPRLDSPAQTVEVVVAIAGSVFTHYTAGIADPALEERFSSHAWTPPELA